MPHASLSADGTPLLGDKKIKDCREPIMRALERCGGTMKFGDFGTTHEQTQWALTMLVRTGKVERVALNGYRLAQSPPTVHGQPAARVTVKTLEPPVPSEEIPVVDEVRRRYARHALLTADRLRAPIAQTIRDLAPDWLTRAQITDFLGDDVKVKAVANALWMMRRDGEVIARYAQEKKGTHAPFEYAMPDNHQAATALPQDFKLTPRRRGIPPPGRPSRTFTPREGYTQRTSVSMWKEDRERAIITLLATQSRYLTGLEVSAALGEPPTSMAYTRILSELRKRKKILVRVRTGEGQTGKRAFEYAHPFNADKEGTIPPSYMARPVRRTATRPRPPTGLAALEALVEDSAIAKIDALFGEGSMTKAEVAAVERALDRGVTWTAIGQALYPGTKQPIIKTQGAYRRGGGKKLK